MATEHKEIRGPKETERQKAWADFDRYIKYMVTGDESHLEGYGLSKQEMDKPETDEVNPDIVAEQAASEVLTEIAQSMKYESSQDPKEFDKNPLEEAEQKKPGTKDYLKASLKDFGRYLRFAVTGNEDDLKGYGSEANRLDKEL